MPAHLSRLLWTGVLLALLAAGGPVQAGWLGFRNETNQPLIVRRASVVKKQVRWGKPVVLYPGEVSWDSVGEPGVKQITVFNAKKRPVYVSKLVCGKDDQYFAIRLVPPGQVRLVPLPLPSRKAKHSSSRP